MKKGDGEDEQFSTRQFLYQSTSNFQLENFMDNYGLEDVPVLMADELPLDLAGPVIVNTDTSDDPGQHWVAMIPENDGGDVIYFDSYGLDCYTNNYYEMVDHIPKHWSVHHVLGRHGKKAIQSLHSRVCGQYSACEILCRMLWDKSLVSILDFVHCPVGTSDWQEGIKLAVNDTKLEAFTTEIMRYTDLSSLKRDKNVILSAVQDKSVL